MTNYEKIKAMSIEEMAEMFAEKILPKACQGCQINCDGYDTCEVACYKWLLSEED